MDNFSGRLSTFTWNLNFTRYINQELSKNLTMPLITWTLNLNQVYQSKIIWAPHYTSQNFKIGAKNWELTQEYLQRLVLRPWRVCTLAVILMEIRVTWWHEIGSSTATQASFVLGIWSRWTQVSRTTPPFPTSRKVHIPTILPWWGPGCPHGSSFCPLSSSGQQRDVFWGGVRAYPHKEKGCLTAE